MPNAHTRTSNIELTELERAELVSMARSRSLPAALALRARIVLACEGVDKASTEVAKSLGIDRNTANKWRARYARDRLASLYDELRPGRPRTVDDEQVAELINTTLHTKPSDGSTHWSTRSLATQTGISKSTVARYLKIFQLKPHRVESFKLSTDPLFVEKLRDVVGLYLNPPENALVLCVDEKSQCQALERTQPMLPLGLGYVEGVTHDYVRHGTTTLFAALNVLNGAILAECKPRHRHQEFLAFLRSIDKAVPAELDVHCIVDNYASHKHPKVKAWLADRPRWHMHFVPTYSSWLNQVERFFAIITDKAIRRGSFTSVKELTKKIHSFVNQYNQNCKPFTWTATADSILAKLGRLCGRITGAGH
ncbi:putative transposase [Pelomonas aquatica]|uniref:Transposase n=1 Tax=Pelomonas aquatica TaxID=431058 RepID=A0ABU1Z5E8_9BURK|nr:IS630 family transposase [Pelomonas aquatica]MDR7295844.1 putative transposase [Pelomonas aquatica]